MTVQPKSSKGSNELVDERPCIEVVGVYFIENDHFAGKRKMADKEVLSSHHAKKCLIDSANTKRGEKCAFCRGKPVSTDPGIIRC